MLSDTEVRVWDPLVRVFHWSLAGAFLLAYVTEDELLGIHVWAGYLILGLLGVRVVWGLIGTRYARFSDFVKSPAKVFDYLKDVIAFRAERHLGHNPAGGAMIIALMLLLIAVSISGLAVYGVEEYAGPMAGVLSGLSHGWGEALEEVHEFFANLTLLFVVLHLLGVAFASLQHRENLVRAMVTGIKKRS